MLFEKGFEREFNQNQESHKCNFKIQKQRIYKALLSSGSEQVLNFDNVLKKIINE